MKDATALIVIGIAIWISSTATALCVYQALHGDIGWAAMAGLNAGSVVVNAINYLRLP